MAYKTAEFDSLVEETMKEWHVPGLAIAVIQGEEIYTKGYGLAQLDSKQKVTADTLFDCASTSKSFTAGAVALLVEDDEKHPDVQWTTPVSKLLPDDFVLPDPLYTEHVTIEDILSHRSGMPGHDASYKNGDSAKFLTRNLRNLPLNKPLRTEYQYCNMMYTAASYMVEKLSDEPYASFLQKRFWDPLQMSNTYHDYDGVQAGNATERLARGYVWNEKTESYSEVPIYAQPEGQGAGSIYSSVGDYAKWIRSMIKGTGPLSQESRKELVKPRSIAHPDDDDTKIPFFSQTLYAMGWVTNTYRGHDVIGHDGSMTGYKALMRYLPEHEWGVVIFANAEGGHYAKDAICSHLLDELLKVPVEDRVDWAKWERDLRQKYKEKGSDGEVPERPENPLPMSLPLEQHAGKFHNAGYHGLVLDLKDGKLQADCTDRCFGIMLFFEHVSEEIFIAEVKDVLDDSSSKCRAEFRVDEEGKKVEAVGVEFVEEMKGHLVWFDRVE